MSRYRPPGPKPSPYITAEGAARLRDELDGLWRAERPGVVSALAAAAAEGDRSENAEYIYRKKQLAGIDRRIRHLRKRLASVTVVDRCPAGSDRVYFGAYVILEDEQGGKSQFRIVGADEIGHSQGNISIDAPLARALLSRQPGDEITLQLATGRKTYVLVEVYYAEPGRSRPHASNGDSL